MESEALLSVARQTVGGVDFCMAATVSDSGVVHARVVQPLTLGEDWSVTFVTSRTSRKANEIERTGRLTPVYQDNPNGAYVTLVGRARLATDPGSKPAAWDESLNQWFPTGPDDPDAVVVRFDTDRIELWSMGKVMPPPKGLRAAVLVRENDGWRATQT